MTGEARPSGVAGREGRTSVSLTLPGDARYATVARIVVGGLAARLNLSYEALDDLQLAVEAVLAERRLVADEEITLNLEADHGEIDVGVGPIDGRAARAALDDGGPLQVVLAAVVDDVSVAERDGVAWLRLEKHVPVLPRD